MPTVLSEESDIELDDTGVLEPDVDDAQEMGVPNRDISEEDMDKALEKRGEAQNAISEGFTFKRCIIDSFSPTIGPKRTPL